MNKKATSVGKAQGFVARMKNNNDRFAIAEAALEQNPDGLPFKEKGNSFNVETNDSQVEAKAHDKLDKNRGERDGFNVETLNESEYVEVDVELIDENPFNARTVYPIEGVTHLKESLLARGQKVPGNAIRNPLKPGRFILIDGHYRLKGLEAARIKKMKLIIEEDLDPLQLYLVSRLLNEERNANTALDDAYAWKKLLDTGVVSNREELGLAVGRDKSEISKALSILEIPEVYLEQLKTNPKLVTVFMGEELAKFIKAGAHESDIQQVITKILKEEISGKQILRMREKLEGEGKKRNHRSLQFAIKTESATGHLKDWKDGRISLELRIEDPVTKSELLKELKQRFGIDLT